jgi:hypothetical protein
LKLRCDEPLLNVALKFNLRRYTKALTMGELALAVGTGRYCQPRHPTHDELLFIELNCIL